MVVASFAVEPLKAIGLEPLSLHLIRMENEIAIILSKLCLSTSGKLRHFVSSPQNSVSALRGISQKLHEKVAFQRAIRHLLTEKT